MYFIISLLARCQLCIPLSLPRASQVVLVVKNPPVNAGDIRDAGPTLQACRPELFLEGSCRRFIMSWNTEPEQRTTESLTLSSSKKPENYRVSLFLPNSRTALAKTAGFMVETVLQKCKKTDAHNVSYCIYDSSKMLKNKVQDIFYQSLSLCFRI